MPAGNMQSHTSLATIRSNWEALAEADPLWAICSDFGRRGQRWDQDEFFATGRVEVATVLKHLRSRSLAPCVGGSALDFGCGVGRLSLALTEHFSSVEGVDIAEKMIEQARLLNTCGSRVSYHHNTAPDLALFDDASFDFVYSSIVLQHVPPPFIRGYIAEFMRTLRPGGLAVFQLPDEKKPEPRDRRAVVIEFARNKVALRTRARTLLESVHLMSPRSPEPTMEMHGIPTAEVEALVEAGGCRVIDCAFTNSTAHDFNGALEYFEIEPTSGWVSKQYCVSKP